MNQTVMLIIVNDTILEVTEQFSLVVLSKDEDVHIQNGRSTLQVTIRDQTGKIYLHARYSDTCISFLAC